MVSRRCSSSDSSASSSPPSSAEEAEAEEGWRGGAADPLVKIELEAAEALADLAVLAMRESENGLDSAGKWGSKGKRAMKRVKSESPVPVDRRFYAADQCEDQAVVDQQRELCRNVIMKSVKAEQEADMLRPCSTSYSSFGGVRSRQNLTEAEKEERRVRRILANRESARQTIRRRQALCEELAKKAADLSWENENLKKEKELALKKYQSLENTNRDLKERVAKAAKVEVESQGDLPTSPPTNCPLLLYNRPPFTPFFWPALVQSTNSAQSQHESQNTACLPSNGPVPATSQTELSNKQDNLMNINGSRTPLYLLPCPWFFPLQDPGNGIHPQPFFGVMNKHDDNSVNNQNSACASSRNGAYAGMNTPTFSMKAKTADSCSVEAKPVNDLKGTSVGYLQNGGGYSNERVRPVFTSKFLDGVQSEFTEAVSPPACQTVSSLPEQNHERDMYPSKKFMDAVAAAEARRRRKELTKLKNHQNRQFRMHC